MVKHLISVEVSQGGRKYATDSKGNALFGRTPVIADKLEAGSWVNCVEETQTKTTNEAGELVDLEPSQYRKNWIITAVFPTKQAAIAASAEEELFEMESKAYAKSQMAEIAKTYKVDAATLAAAL